MPHWSAPAFQASFDKEKEHMGMLTTLVAKTVEREYYNRRVSQLAATIVGEARVRLKGEGSATPTRSEVNRRATGLYLEGARAFDHGMLKRMDFHKAIKRLTA
jgi:hypothetical protein